MSASVRFWSATIRRCTDDRDALKTAVLGDYLERMLIHRTKTLAVLLTLFAALLPAAAAQAQPAAAVLAAEDQADIARIEAYLNAITTMDSRFAQFSASGFASGRIVLSRPGEMRIEYEPPVPVLMVASGRWLMYHDRKLEQTSYLPVKRTPAHFLLRERIDLSDGVIITKYERANQAMRLTLVDSENPDAGSLTFVFADAPLQLVKWRVVDAQGQEIEVALVEPQFGVAVDDDQFSTVDPLLRNGRR